MWAKKATPAGAALHHRQHLQQEPEADEEDRRHPQDEDDHQGVHAGVGEEHHVGGHHAGDGAAGADHGHREDRRRVGADQPGRAHRGGQGLGGRRRQAGEQVEGQEAAAPQRVLDVVPEDPEREHVAGQVHQAAVEEHAGEDGEGRRDDVARPDVLEGEELVGDGAAHQDRVREAGGELPAEGRQVGRQDGPGDDRDLLAGDVVAQGKHGLQVAITLRAAVEGSGAPPDTDVVIGCRAVRGSDAPPLTPSADHGRLVEKTP